MHVAELHHRLKGGDISVLGEVFELYHKTLFSFAYHILRDKEDARDAVHDVFAKLCNKPETWDRIVDFKGYLMASVRNHCIYFLRCKSSSQLKATEYQAYHTGINSNASDSLGIFEQQVQNQEETFIENILSFLPRKRRAVIRLFYLEDLSYQQISEELGITKHTVKTQLRLARSSFCQLKHLIQTVLILYCILH